MIPRSFGHQTGGLPVAVAIVMRSTVLVVVIVVGAPALVRADDPPPGFVTIDRFDASARGGVDVADFLNKENTIVRVEPHAQYVDRASGFGGYAAVPITYLHLRYEPAQTVLGDVDVGGIYVLRSLVVHGGITLPTASEATTADMQDVNEYGSLARLNDRALHVPRGLSVRAGVSRLFTSGSVFGRLDLGLDGTPSGTLVRANGGIGFGRERVVLMIEMVNVFGRNGWQPSLALSTRILAGPVQPYAAIALQPDLGSIGEQGSILHAVATGGLEAAL